MISTARGRAGRIDPGSVGRSNFGGEQAGSGGWGAKGGEYSGGAVMGHNWRNVIGSAQVRRFQYTKLRIAQLPTHCHLSPLHPNPAPFYSSLYLQGTAWRLRPAPSRRIPVPPLGKGACAGAALLLRCFFSFCFFVFCFYFPWLSLLRTLRRRLLLATSCDSPLCVYPLLALLFSSVRFRVSLFFFTVASELFVQTRVCLCICVCVFFGLFIFIFIFLVRVR